MSDKKPAFRWGAINPKENTQYIYSVFFDEDDTVKIVKSDLSLNSIKEVVLTMNQAYNIRFIDIRALDEYFKTNKDVDTNND